MGRVIYFVLLTITSQHITIYLNDIIKPFSLTKSEFI